MYVVNRAPDMFESQGLFHLALLGATGKRDVHVELSRERSA